MQLFDKKWQMAMVVFVLALFFGSFSSPASAMEWLGNVKKAQKQVNQQPTEKPVDVTQIDPNKKTPEQLLKPIFIGPPIQPSVFSEKIEEFVTLDFKVEDGVDGYGRLYKTARFIGKSTYGPNDGFLVAIEPQAETMVYPGATKDPLFYNNGQQIFLPPYPHSLRIFPAAHGMFSTTEDGITFQNKEGYVVGEAYEATVTTYMGNILHDEAESAAMPPHPSLDPVLVSWDKVLRAPKMCPKENPPFNGWQLHKTPPTGPYLNEETACLSPNGGFWVEAFVHNPDWKSLFDGLFLTYQDTSNMEFGAVPGNVGSDVVAIGLKNMTLKLSPGEHNIYIQYYPGNERFDMLYVRAFVKDHNGRYIVPIPALSRRY